MKALGIVGSPRKEGNCEILTAHTLKAIAEEGLETELVRLAGLDIRPCNACMACRKEEELCTIKDDLWPVYEKMKAADALILAAPVYYSAVNGLMTAFKERVGFIAGPQRRFKRKVGGPLVVARRAGMNFAHAELMFWFHNQEIIVPGSTYWNIAIGREKGEVENDEEGMKTAWNFGKNVAWLVKKLNA